jgi:microcystin-dependent protein
MTSPFIAEIRMFAGNFAPRGNAFCNGQIIGIAQNTALFSLLGTTYGGNGTTTFALPDLRGRMAIGNGNGPGLTPRVLGQQGGVENVTLLSTQMPAHTHVPQASSLPGTQASPASGVWAASASGRTPPPLYVAPPAAVAMSTSAIGITGGNQPHQNMQPYLAISYIIATQGVFPARN